MTKDPQIPDWFLFVTEKAPLLFFGGGIVALIAVIGSAVYFNHKLDELAEGDPKLPPRNYEAPDLGEYAVKSTDVDGLPLKQVVYVPAYSHIYYDGGRPCLMETTLSIRNTDTQKNVYVKSVDYFDSNGKRIKEFLESPIQLTPLQSIAFVVERRDSSGGSGANFLVEWRSENDTSKPLIGSVMVGSVGTQGFALERDGFALPGPKN